MLFGHFTVLHNISHFHPLSTTAGFKKKKKRQTRKRRNIPENVISLRSKETRLTGLIETKKQKIKEKYSKIFLHLTFPNLPLTALIKYFLVNIFDLFVLFQNNEGSRYW